MKKNYGFWPKNIFFLLFLSFFSVFCLRGEERKALLIANTRYKYFENLESPGREAQELKKALEVLGFKVTILENTSKKTMISALESFSAEINKNQGTYIFHYGGHALQFQEKYFLIPSDSRILFENQLSSKAIDLSAVTEKMADSDLSNNIIIIDACRDNPLSAGKKKIQSAFSEKSLFPNNKLKNYFLCFSSEPGKTANDEVFTPVLTEKIIQKKALDEIFNETAEEVSFITNNSQKPVIYNHLKNKIYLAGKSADKALANNAKNNIEKLFEEGFYEIDYAYHGRISFSNSQYKKAFEYYLKAEKLTDNEDLRKLAWLFQSGKGGIKDETKALEFYEKSSQIVNVLSMYESGLSYYHGKGCKIDLKKAKEYFLKAAKKNHIESASLAGYFFQNGLGGKTDYKNAKKWNEKAAGQGNAFALNNLGLLYRNGDGTNQDFSKAFDCFTKSAESGNIEALYNLAEMYMENLSFDDAGLQNQDLFKNTQKAYELYQKASDKGLSQAQNALGNIFLNGLSVNNKIIVKKDYTKAFDLFSKAAAKNNPDALNSLGFLYQNGLGVNVNYGKAIDFYTRAIKQNNLQSKNNLGFMYQKGLGLEKNYNRAFELYSQAAEKNIPAAQMNLAYLYENGSGVKKDLNKALEYYSLALENGMTEAGEEIKRLEKSRK